MNLSIKNNGNLSRNTLESSVPRALHFLRAVGTDAIIMQALAQTGFDEAAQKQGWALVLTAYSATNGPVAAGVNDTPLSDAKSVRNSTALGIFRAAQRIMRRSVNSVLPLLGLFSCIVALRPRGPAPNG